MSETASAASIKGATLFVIGKVVSLSEKLDWFQPKAQS